MDKADASTAKALVPLLGTPETQATRILALWGLERLGSLSDEMLKTLARDGDAQVRRNALRIAGLRKTDFEVDLVSALKDGDAQVRLEALGALSRGKVSAHGAAAVVAQFPGCETPWARSASVAALSSNWSGGINAALKSGESKVLAPLVEELAAQLVLSGQVVEPVLVESGEGTGKYERVKTG